MRDMKESLQLKPLVKVVLISFIVSTKADFLDKLRRELNVLPQQGSDYSLAATPSEEEVNHKISTLALSSLLEKKKDEEQVLKTCCPSSLITWLKNKKIDSPFKQSDRKNCVVRIPDLRRGNEWDQMDKKLNGDKEKLSTFPKVSHSIHTLVLF